MSVFRRLLKDRSGNSILPVTGYLDDYSVSPVDTGHTWITGAHIWKVTIPVGPMPNATTKNVDITGLSATKIIKIEGYAYRTLDEACFPLPLVSTTAANQISVTCSPSAGVIYITAGIDRSALDEAYLTIYYLKS